MITTMDGSSIDTEITAENSQSLYALTNSLANGDIFTAMPTAMERVVEVTTKASSSSVSTIMLDQRTVTTPTVGNSKKRNDLGAILLSYYSRNVGVLVLAVLSFVLLLFSIASHAFVRYLMRRRVRELSPINQI